jgi:hypothetical protein
MDTDVICPIVIEFHGDSVVQIFRSFGIDGKNTFLPKIFTNFELPFWNADIIGVSTRSCLNETTDVNLPRGWAEDT